MTERLSNFDGAIFVAAPRDMSLARLKQILRHYLPKGRIVFGISKESYVWGFEGQTQFKMLEKSRLEGLVKRVQSASGNYKVEILEYSQVELASLVQKHSFKRILLVNGSWKYTFQNNPAYRSIIDKNIPFKYISPFADEQEAKAYEAAHVPVCNFPATGEILSEAEMFSVADESARQSFDYSFQTGLSLGKKFQDKYRFLTEAFNKVVPYQTYAMHHGNAREKYVSSVQDTGHYDTVHAEMLLLTKALRQGIDLDDTSMFINLLPCPSCARTLSETGIKEVVYKIDHSGGYADDLLRSAGKAVRKVA